MTGEAKITLLIELKDRMRGALGKAKQDLQTGLGGMRTATSAATKSINRQIGHVGEVKTGMRRAKADLKGTLKDMEGDVKQSVRKMNSDMNAPMHMRRPKVYDPVAYTPARSNSGAGHYRESGYTVQSNVLMPEILFMDLKKKNCTNQNERAPE